MIVKTVLTVLLLAMIVGAIVGVKASQILAMIEAGKAMQIPPESVATRPLEEMRWVQSHRSIGSVTPVRGVTLSSELPGIISEIQFESGSEVEAGQILVRLDARTEQAQLRAAVAADELAQIELRRARDLLANSTISRAEFDGAEARALQTEAQVANLSALIEKKSVTAPFSGRLGIRQINLGQYINPGEPIVNLQSIDPIFVSFSLPQRALASLELGYLTRIESDAFPGKTLTGEVTAIASEIDPVTRMVEVQATFSNPEAVLVPGMFVQVAVELPEAKVVAATPTTSVVYASFGNSIFVLIPNEEGPGFKAEQRFVKLGERRGDFVEVVSGLAIGDRVITDGAFKLQNGMAVMPQDDRAPKALLNPAPENR